MNNQRCAIVTALGLCVFALFIHQGFPLRAVAIVGFLVAAIALAWALAREPSPAKLLGVKPFSKKAALYCAVGLGVGVSMAFAYRAKLNYELLPKGLTFFTLTAALVGATEELIYRGFIQGAARPWGAGASMTFATLSHTAYKCALFALAAYAGRTDVLFLGIVTLVGGMIFALMREVSSSVWPPLIAHVCFDVLVYGESHAAPWWVWS